MDEELYIRMENGRPVDHPMLRSNIETAFPDVDFDNLPNWLCRFERIDRPAVGVYEIANGPIYVQDGDLVRDQWIVRPMTEDEIIIKQNRVQRYFATDNGHLTASWVFDPETCAFKAPVDYPTDGKNYTWHEQSRSWVEIPDPVYPATIQGEDGTVRKPYPLDGGLYQWDENTSEWIPRQD